MVTLFKRPEGETTLDTRIAELSARRGRVLTGEPNPAQPAAPARQPLAPGQQPPLSQPPLALGEQPAVPLEPPPSIGTPPKDGA